MKELSERRKRLVVLGGSVSSMSLLVLTVARHHLWITFACIGVQGVALVSMMRELAALRNEECGEKGICGVPEER